MAQKLFFQELEDFRLSRYPSRQLTRWGVVCARYGPEIRPTTIFMELTLICGQMGKGLRTRPVNIKPRGCRAYQTIRRLGLCTMRQE